MSTPPTPPNTLAAPIANLDDQIIHTGSAKAGEEDRYYYASQWELIRWRFGRHKLAVISMCHPGPAVPDRCFLRVSRALRD